MYTYMHIQGYTYMHIQGYTYMHIQGGTAVDWDFRNRLLQASKSSHNTKLEVARVLAGKYDSAALQVFYAPVSKET
jgi:hypothetical protein